jgi:hypothetical protein
MPRTFTQKVITKLQIHIEQCQENNEYIYGSNESRITEKTIASLRNQSHRFENQRSKSKRNYSSGIQTSISGNDKKNYRKDETNISKYSMKLSCTWLQVIPYINISYKKFQPQTSTSTNIIRRNKQWKISKINPSNEEI